MKTLPALVLAAVVGLGLAGGLLAYQVAAGTGGPSSALTAAPAAPAAHRTPARVRPPKPRPIVRWAPCRAPAVRRGNACVTEQVRTIVVPAPSYAGSAPAPAAAPPAPPAPAAAPVAARSAPQPPRSAAPAAHAHHEDGGEHEGGDD